ncbi:2-phospho-L-lactate guanylyltransferase [Tsuneonella sp. CC-YZS046]|uniref:2-phospho-L-lactate guanylyltransferase n=1 Tax=Tsuneonella sp. CC-YZS046 TaxID=3042152 RepID=UPI002D78A55A|nr:2-phospho-L-lactate guanylyltransferase [Tsuneonella sp. CC-YZS046]WRO67440.1 2-phospho-L-lactate guanylyltransferase [Tsuneonella sp. CC-YZS046]
MADLRVLIAVRPVEDGKSRLASVLPADKRSILNQRLFDHVCEIGLSFLPADRIIIVSRSRALLEQSRARGMEAVLEQGSGLNEALEQGAAVAASQGSGPLLALATDLPGLGHGDLAAMVEASRTADVVIALDHAGRGTNALLMARPHAIPFRYGPGSLAAHISAAREAGLAHVLVERPGLALDVDTAEDLARLQWADIVTP